MQNPICVKNVSVRTTECSCAFLVYILNLVHCLVHFALFQWIYLILNAELM